MIQIEKDLKAFGDDSVRLYALDVGDKANAAGVVFVSRVVQAMIRRHFLFQYG